MRTLITSFDIWETHHVSNSSDDLLAAMLKQDRLNEFNGTIALLRKLPVDFQLAPQQVIAKMNAFKPEMIVCCGMAEQRSQLTVESNGTDQAETLWTAIDLDQLIENLAVTQVSHDAGNFVCNRLYYSILKQIQQCPFDCQCLFIHVPVLHETNIQPILKDFSIILQRLQTWQQN